MKIKEKIKNLTKEQCVAIAKIIRPEVNWQYTVSKKCPWDGHDLINEDETFILQLNYSSNNNPLILLFRDLEEVRISQELIYKAFEYIDSCYSKSVNELEKKTKDHLVRLYLTRNGLEITLVTRIQYSSQQESNHLEIIEKLKEIASEIRTVESLLTAEQIKEVKENTVLKPRSLFI